MDAALRDATDLASMDFATRNMYRSAIEALSRRSDVQRVANQRMRLSAPSKPRPLTIRTRCADAIPGITSLGADVARSSRPLAIAARSVTGPVLSTTHSGPSGYIAAVLAVAVLIVALPVAALFMQGVASLHLALCALLGIVPAIDLAVALVNRAVMRGFDATMLPGLALREGVPASMRTMVVVPTLLTTREALETQLERLEVHYLASTEGELHFALLTDWTDAASEHTPSDAALLQVAVEGIARLNRTHSAPDARRAFLCAASPPRLERRTATMDGLGAQARQAARAESAAAWRHRHVVHERRRRSRADGCALRHHARCRYAPAARDRATLDRQACASAESSSVRFGLRAASSRAMPCCSRA